MLWRVTACALRNDAATDTARRLGRTSLAVLNGLEALVVDGEESGESAGINGCNDSILNGPDRPLVVLALLWTILGHVFLATCPTLPV